MINNALQANRDVSEDLDSQGTIIFESDDGKVVPVSTSMQGDDSAQTTTSAASPVNARASSHVPEEINLHTVTPTPMAAKTDAQKDTDTSHITGLEQGEEVAETGMSSVAGTPQKRKIMVVEDDFFISDIYDVKLSSAGYEIILANNGREAIEKLTSGVRPHLMLLDIVMPYMDGFDVLKAMSENAQWQSIPVVLLTNLSQKEDIDQAMKHGAKDYLIKSHFTPSEVLSKVEKYILKD